MELTPWKLHHVPYIMQLPNGTYTMEVTSWNWTSWNVHHGTYTMELTSWNLHHEGYLMEHTSWLPHWNLHHGSYLMELTPWKLPYTMEVTWTYIMEVT